MVRQILYDCRKTSSSRVREFVAADHERMNTILRENCAMTAHIDLKTTNEIIGLCFGNVVVISDDNSENLVQTQGDFNPFCIIV